MGMMHFRLKGGEHVEGNKTYKKGDIVPSMTDLVARFKGKFERIFSQEQLEGIAAASSQPTIPEPKTEVEEDKTSTSVSSEEVEEVEEVDEIDDLEEEEEEEEVEEVDEIDDLEEEEEEEEVAPGYGQDVTEEFPKAKKAGYRVHEPSKAWFDVIDPDADDPADAVMNESKLRRKDVDSFLAKLKD